MTSASTQAPDTNEIGTASTPLTRTGARIEAQARDWRAIIFRVVVALILGLVAAQGARLLLSPWMAAMPAAPGIIPEMHRWHDALMAVWANILICGSLVAAAWQPRRAPLPVQYVLLAIGLQAIMESHPPNVAVLVTAAVIAPLVVATYPATRALLKFRREAPVSRPLLALAVIVAVPLLLHAWTNVNLQYIDRSEHALHGHWAGAAGITLSLALAGLLVATRGPGWQMLGIVTGIAYLYLGMAALALPFHDGSWGATGGALALLAGAALLAAIVVEGRRACALGMIKASSPR